MGVRRVFLIPVALAAIAASQACAVEVKVDFAYPAYPHQNPDPENAARHEATLKDGWIFFSPQSDPDWQYDLWRHDPRTMENVGDSGIDITVACGYEGDTSLTVAGMEPLEDSVSPTGFPEGDPIANSYVLSHRHYGNHSCTPRPYWGSIFLTLSGTGGNPQGSGQPLEAGVYRVSSWHNDAANFLLEGYDVMPSITAASADPRFPNAVAPIEQAYNVPIQRELDDDNLQRREIAFLADGSAPVTIHYMSPEGYDHRMGGAAVLNAFIVESSPILQAYGPSPADGAENVEAAGNLSWSPGTCAAYHDVYIGTDENAVSAADRGSPQFKGTFEPNNFEATVEFGRRYYWRIDEVNDLAPESPWKGAVWSFSTDNGRASDPEPADGGTASDLQPRLQWSRGPAAEWHDIYFGSDFDVVAGAQTSSAEYKGRFAADYYDFYVPGLLEMGRRYYWRIDAVSFDETIVKGSIWSFTVCSEEQAPAGDLNGDCSVGIGDLEIMAEDWLKGDYSVTGVADLIVHYSFEAADGYKVPDVTDNQYDGETYDHQTGPVKPPIEEGYLRLEHESRESAVVVEVPKEAFNEQIADEISVSVWVNWDDPNTMPGGNTILFGAMGGYGDLYAPAFVMETDWQGGLVTLWDSSPCSPAVCDGLEEEDWSGSWNHYVFVKSLSQRFLKIYHNGQLCGEVYSDQMMPKPIDLAWIGINPDFPIYVKMYLHDIYTGLLDEFRIYNRALSAEEVAYIYSGKPQYVPLVSRANLYDGEGGNSKVVNFRDYALLADNWLARP